MVFVPYEFGAALFQYIYPHIRLLGSVFLVGAAMVLLGLMYPTWPAFVGRVGRAFLLAAFAVYWWAVSVLPVSPTGTILYLFLMGLLVMERRSLRRGQGLLLVFISSVTVCFGGLMAWAPQDFQRFAMAALGPYVRLVGILFFMTGALLVMGLWRKHPLPCRLALGVQGLLFLNMAVAVASRGAWAGMGVYSVLSLGCALLVTVHRWPTL
ncbi:sensor histidine kinase, partial [Corallococcus sp. CA053C]